MSLDGEYDRDTLSERIIGELRGVCIRKLKLYTMFMYNLMYALNQFFMDSRRLFSLGTFGNISRVTY